MKFQMYDVVQLKCAKAGLATGTRGTIVMTYEHPEEGYEVEFPDLKGEVPTLTLYPEDMEPVAPNARG
jgi:Domain of unknown function (DUF4926)